MSVSAIANSSSLAVQQLVSMRKQFDELQRQLASGLKSGSYAGLGLEAGMAVSLNSQLSAIRGYESAIEHVTMRITMMTNALNGMIDLTSMVKKAMVDVPIAPNGSGTTLAQQTAHNSLDQLIGMLNARAGDRYLFSGRTTDQPAVEALDRILNGNGTQAGLKQLISERRQADLGASGLGRLVLSQPTATSIQIDEDAVSPFGFKLASVTSSLTNATVSGPAGSPASLTVDLSGGNPNAGDTVTFRFTLPDGTTENLTLTATTDSPPGDNQFTIGATAAATTDNLEAALTGALGTLAATALTAASSVAASNEFFDGNATSPPLRVNGPPFDSATSQVAGTTTNTLIWYTGEISTDPARSSATARIDQSLVVSYGARANETAIRNLVQNMANLAAVTISPTAPNAVGLSAALNQRLMANLAPTPGVQSIRDIETDLASAHTSLNSAKLRHRQTSVTLDNFLQEIQGVSSEEVGAQILALQTRMQASMQTTALLFRTSLVNYIG